MRFDCSAVEYIDWLLAVEAMIEATIFADKMNRSGVICVLEPPMTAAPCDLPVRRRLFFRSYLALQIIPSNPRHIIRG